jgi:tripartite-type tricarboxylate transporter receptor subunit TctC
MITRRGLAGSIAAATLLGICVDLSLERSAAAADWPSHPVRIVCPAAAGGGIDAVTRLLASRLSEIWAQQVVVENRTGGGGTIAAEAVTRAPPDGTTLLAAASSLAVAGLLLPTLGYDPLTELAPVTLIATYPNIMVVPLSSPAGTVAEFIAYAKANPGKITYASGGHGSSLHLAGELFKRAAGIEMAHVPYRGAAPAFNDLIPGRVDVMFNLVASSLPLVRAGKIRALAIATLERTSVMPELPTVAESGLPGFDVSSWLGLFAPVRTPAQVVSRLHADTIAALADVATRSKLAEMGVVPVASGPTELARTVESERTKWGPVIKESGISIRD